MADTKKNRTRYAPVYLAILAGIAFLLSAVSSELPDGLEAAAEEVSLEESPSRFSESLPDLGAWNWRGRLLGVVLTGAAGWAFCFLVSGRKKAAQIQ